MNGTTARPVAIAQAAGLHVSRIDGGAMVYNQDTPLSARSSR